MPRIPFSCLLIDNVTLTWDASQFQQRRRHNCAFICHLPSIEAGGTQAEHKAESGQKGISVHRLNLFPRAYGLFQETKTWLTRLALGSSGKHRARVSRQGTRDRWVGCVIYCLASYLRVGCPPPHINMEKGVFTAVLFHLLKLSCLYFSLICWVALHSFSNQAITQILLLSSCGNCVVAQLTGAVFFGAEFPLFV